VLEPVSTFRSIAHQRALVERKLARGDAIDRVFAVNAVPGYSEHHGGHAIDIGTPGCPALDEAFEHTPAFAWLQQHAERFGFRLSYPRDNRHGVIYEPWHWCFKAA
jgi:D-alanyl-D-alanine carboxypeptidase